jgi:hypothetical protein
VEPSAQETEEGHFRKRTLQLMRHVTAFLLLLVVMAPVWAALPPLSPQELKKEADHILIGQVNNVTVKEVEVEGGTDRVYRLNFRVDDRKKGTLRSGLTLPIQCRQTAERPDGWAGPQGQNEIPAEGQKVRLFVRETPDGIFELLEPNGWEAIK